MTPFLKKGAKIKLIPSAEWTWDGWDGIIVLSANANMEALIEAASAGNTHLVEGLNAENDGAGLPYPHSTII